MAPSLQTATVADSISKLVVTGLVIKDIDEIPVSPDPRQSTLMPLPDYITDFDLERDSFGGGSSALMTARYTLHYRLFYKQVGTGRALKIEPFAGLIAMAALIMSTVAGIDILSGAVDILPQDVSNAGQVLAPDGSAWFGCDLAFRVEEFLN